MSISSLCSIALLTLVLAGCQKNDAVVVPGSDVVTQSESVATPTADLPPSITAITPQNTETKMPQSGDANGPSQASANSLTSAQESSAMPLPGQANDHSIPAPLVKK